MNTGNSSIVMPVSNIQVLEEVSPFPGHDLIANSNPSCLLYQPMAEDMGIGPCAW
jgi:hypothetical protein